MGRIHKHLTDQVDDANIRKKNVSRHTSTMRPATGLVHSEMNAALLTVMSDWRQLEPDTISGLKRMHL
ncbi:hypothetical protein Tco_0058705 [Tanacetum coccineum]